MGLIASVHLQSAHRGRSDIAGLEMGVVGATPHAPANLDQFDRDVVDCHCQVPFERLRRRHHGDPVEVELAEKRRM
jgi:hypothetical protein